MMIADDGARDEQPALRGPEAVHGRRVQGERRSYTHIQVPAARLGFPAVEARVHVKLLRDDPEGILLLVWTEGPGAAWVPRWLSPFGPTVLPSSGTALQNVVRIRCARPPIIWRRLLAGAPIDGLVIRTDGQARLNIKGGADEAAHQLALLDGVGALRLGEDDDDRRPDIHARRSGLRPITARQRDILVVALAEGYYEVPRRISQTGLARLLGMSPAALSETLRRAEGNMIRAQIMEGLPQRASSNGHAPAREAQPRARDE